MLKQVLVDDGDVEGQAQLEPVVPVPPDLRSVRGENAVTMPSG